MTLDRFTAGAQAVLQLAEQEARRLGRSHVGSEHVLLALIAEPDGPAGWALAELGWSPERSRTALIGLIAQRSASTQGDAALTAESKQAIEHAVAEANRLQHHFVGSEHLVLGLLHDGVAATEIIQSMGINRASLRAIVERRMWEDI